jgi:hypothetical protein
MLQKPETRQEKITMKHYYAVTTSSEAHDVAYAFDSAKLRAEYLEGYIENGYWLITAKQARKYNEIRHYYGKQGNDWFSQLYPKKMWWK